MISQYYIDNEKQELTNELDIQKNKIKALQNIRIISKKNGEPFKNLSQNFKNANLTGGTFGMDYNLTYYFTTKNNGYQNSYFNIYLYTDSLDKNDIRYDPKPNGYIRKMCIMNFDEIKTAIQKEIDETQKYILSLEKSLENFDIIMDKYINKYYKLIEDLKKDTSNMYSLEYAVRHIIAKVN